LIDHFVFVIVFLAGDFALVDFALFGVARLAVVFAFALALGDGRSTGWKQPPMGWVLTVRMKIFPFFLALGLSIIKNSRDNFLVINKGEPVATMDIDDDICRGCSFEPFEPFAPFCQTGHIEFEWAPAAIGVPGDLDRSKE
jgi:hypothetical protein